MRRRVDGGRRSRGPREVKDPRSCSFSPQFGRVKLTFAPQLISLGSTLLSSLVSTSPTSQQLHLHLLTTHFTEPPLFRALSLVAITHFKAVCDSAPDEAGRSTLLQLLTFLEQSAELGVEVREGLTRIVGSFVGVEAVGEEVEERVLLWLEKGWEREERGE